MRALIQLPDRVAEVRSKDFPVASPLFWVDCPDDATPQTHFYDGAKVVAIPAPIETPEETQARLASAVQAHLDSKARERGYDGILSAVSYVTSKDATFQGEAIGYRDFRDSAWRYCYQQLAAVQAGERAIPTGAELIAEINVNCALVLP